MSLPEMITKKLYPNQNRLLTRNLKTHFIRNLINKSRTWYVCDSTYIRATGRFYYLCVIFSLKVITFRLSIWLYKYTACLFSKILLYNREEYKNNNDKTLNEVEQYNIIPITIDTQKFNKIMVGLFPLNTWIFL